MTLFEFFIRKEKQFFILISSKKKAITRIFFLSKIMMEITKIIAGDYSCNLYHYFRRKTIKDDFSTETIIAFIFLGEFNMSFVSPHFTKKNMLKSQTEYIL